MIYPHDSHSPVMPENGDYWVAPDANIIGRVTIGAAASVWFGSTLRGDNEPIVVGAGSNIQENCILHTDMGFPLTIGKDCTIGHRAILHGCTIGDETLVGMGAIIMNGARIGRNCQIGAGALVTEGKVIPDGCLVVGMPGKVVRPLDIDARQALKEAVIHYQAKMRMYRASITR